MVRVMIADDAPVVRELLKDILSISEHELIAEAVDGDDAIEKFAATKPDVLLLDIDMPKKDGLTALMEIKRMNPNAKVVMVTVHDDMEMIQDCIKAGALTYIIKPFDTKQLMNAILFADQENKKS
jgi:two-component system chemotaxis response regulator CheY